MKEVRLLAFAAALGAVLASSSTAQTKVRMLYEFNGQDVPLGVTAGPNGVLYGITGGGYDTSGAFGYVFELQPPVPGSGGAWTETVLHTFTGQNGDGSNFVSFPIPVVTTDRTIYGTTNSGGANGYGTVFELQPPLEDGGAWTETILYSFPASLNPFSESNVILVNGVLYGVWGGGAYGAGEVFKLEPPPGNPPGVPWVETTLYEFTGGSDGADPFGIAMGHDGKIYGLADGGGSVGEGAVFELTPSTVTGAPWNEKVLYSFPGDADGGGGIGPPIIASDGSLYGATATTVFKLTPPESGATAWTETLLYSFTGNQSLLRSPIVMRNGAIYGTAADFYGFDVYKLEPPAAGSGPWTETVLNSFQNSYPWGAIVVNKQGALFGTTLDGPGVLNDGVAYEIKP